MSSPVEFCSVVCIKCLWVSSEHLNYAKHHMVKAVYRFQVSHETSHEEIAGSIATQS